MKSYTIIDIKLFIISNWVHDATIDTGCQMIQLTPVRKAISLSVYKLYGFENNSPVILHTWVDFTWN